MFAGAGIPPKKLSYNFKDERKGLFWDNRTDLFNFYSGGAGVTIGRTFATPFTLV
jgi:hypothetical protein